MQQLVRAMETQVVRGMVYLQTLRDREEGQGMVEYALILVAISIAAIAILPEIGTKIVTIFTNIKNAL